MNVRHVSILAAGTDSEGERIRNAIERVHVVEGGRDGLEALVCELLRAPACDTPCTIDLIGHSSSGESVLVFGDWLIDATRASVRAYFRGLADNDVFARLGVQSLRLLGCQTAATSRGRETICTLAEIIGVDVLGTSQMVHASDYDRDGFRDDHAHALVSARDLLPSRGTHIDLATTTGRRALDVETLPSSPLVEWRQSWRRRVVDLEAARAILQLIRRGDGAQMPGPLVDPVCEIALPAIGRPAWYYSIQVLPRYEFVRAFPDGAHHAGVVYPVHDAEALRALLEP